MWKTITVVLSCHRKTRWSQTHSCLNPNGIWCGCSDKDSSDHMTSYNYFCKFKPDMTLGWKTTYRKVYSWRSVNAHEVGRTMKKWILFIFVDLWKYSTDLGLIPFKNLKTFLEYLWKFHRMIQLEWKLELVFSLPHLFSINFSHVPDRYNFLLWS